MGINTNDNMLSSLTSDYSALQAGDRIFVTDSETQMEGRIEMINYPTGQAIIRDVYGHEQVDLDNTEWYQLRKC